MRIWKYNIEEVSDDYEHEGFGFSITHKYWYLWNIWIDLSWFHFYLEICRTDWNKAYKDSCKNYTRKCKHCMDCNECKECYEKEY